jgi:hypothetical protein
MFKVTQLFDRVTVSSEDPAVFRMDLTVEGFSLHESMAMDLARALNAHFATRNREINKAVQNQEGY